MNVNEYLKKQENIVNVDGYSYRKLCPKIICSDGTSLSVQVSDGHYCTPRINKSNYYSTVEVGFPSIRPPESWGQYFDGQWQEAGFCGWLKRVINDDMIPYYFKSKNWNQLKRRIFTFDNATDSVYGYVPVELVDEFINSHGGIDYPRTIEVINE